MSRLRLAIVLLLSFALPFGASAAVRMQVQMGNPAAPPAAAAMAPEVLATQATMPCAQMAGNGPASAMHPAAAAGSHSNACCAGGADHQCQLCVVPVPLVPAIAGVFPGAVSQFVAAPADLPGYAAAASGRWRPPRRS